MKHLQSIIIILLAAISTNLVDSQDCSMHKVQIICEHIQAQPIFNETEVVFCYGADSIKVIYPGSSVVTVLNNNGSKATNFAEIEGLMIRYATVRFIPTDIAVKLPNLKALSIRSSDLLSVSKEDLRQFGNKLMLADFSRNAITSIDADLFVYNRNLKMIILDSNPIRYIQPEFSGNLKRMNLKIFQLESACCDDVNFNTEKGHDIATFKWDFENCIDLTATFETQNMIKSSLCEEAKTSDLIKEVASIIGSKLDLITESMNVMNARISALEKLIKKQKS